MQLYRGIYCKTIHTSIYPIQNSNNQIIPILIFMEYTVIEGKKKNSSNKLREGFRYVKVRESESFIFVKCSLFRTHSSECNGKINKLANLL